MSKIEEALRRAQQERAQDPAVAGGAVPDRQDRSGRTEDERQPVSRGELVGLTAAEEIAHMREERPRGPAELTQLRIIDPETADPRVADAFRQLRISLLQKSTDSNFVLVVTSAGNEGGASFVALNLAVAIAFDESKTALLVNANLRNPSLDRLVQTEGEAAGLTDYLGGSEKEVRHIIHPIGVPRVRLIPSGRQSRAAAEYFTMPQLRHLLRSLRQRYRERYIIIDAPPVTQSADARILSELADYTLLVVPYGKVTSTQVSEAALAIGEEKLVGCVLNNELRIPLLSRSAQRRAR